MKRRICQLGLGVILLMISQWGLGQIAEFTDPVQQAAYDKLLKELRCVTCPNQSIADSTAPVAQAMQEEIYLRLQQGESCEAVREYLISHYGDYVLYRPALNNRTYLLWIGPFLLLGIGFLLWGYFIKSSHENH